MYPPPPRLFSDGATHKIYAPLRVSGRRRETHNKLMASESTDVHVQPNVGTRVANVHTHTQTRTLNNGELWEFTCSYASICICGYYELWNRPVSRRHTLLSCVGVWRLLRKLTAKSQLHQTPSAISSSYCTPKFECLFLCVCVSLIMTSRTYVIPNIIAPFRYPHIMSKLGERVPEQKNQETRLSAWLQCKDQTASNLIRNDIICEKRERENKKKTTARTIQTHKRMSINDDCGQRRPDDGLLGVCVCI